MGSPLPHTDDGRLIVTHSMLKSFERCPNKARYTYAERLKPRALTASEKPLERGTWLHKLWEEYYAGNGWKSAHDALTAEFETLSFEERDDLGDLPTEIAQIMRSYLWHYGADKSDPFHGWKILGTEGTLECDWPDGSGVYRMRYDLLIEDERGIWLVDHKSHKALPDTTFRLLDKASALYLWCARENGIDAQGFIWNYVRTTPPSRPKLLKDGSRISKTLGDTDLPTFVGALREFGLPLEDYADTIRRLKAARWVRDGVQISPFFRRDTLVKDDDMLYRVVTSAMRTRDRLAEQVWDNATERFAEVSCQWQCQHSALCTTELFSGDDSIESRNLRRQRYRTGDPLAYYNDVKPSEGESS